jgi:tripartite-type tricarboxylate transporter receptor subunit TctC
MYRTLRLIVATFAAAGAALASAGQPEPARYPTRPIQMIVAYPQGGGTDILARIVAAELAKSLGQTVVVINKPGASGAIGTEAAARAAPDGYTLLMATANVTVNPAVDASTRVSAKDFAPVTLLAESPFVLVASPELPVSSLEDLVGYTRAHPGKVNYASTGTGSPQQLVAELLKKSARLDWTHVPYQGGSPALTALLSDQVQVMFSNVLPVQPYLQAGKLRALGTTTRERLPAAGSVPTLIEQGQRDFVVSFWTGVLVPAGAPAAIVNKLNDALMSIMQQPAIRERLAREGSLVTPLPSTKFATYIDTDAQRWRQFAAAAGVRADQ